jgi:hypothetical protein
MTDPRNPADRLNDLIEGVEPADEAEALARERLAAALEGAVEAGEGEPVAAPTLEQLAALADGQLGGQDAVALLSTAQGRAVVEAAMDFTEAVKAKTDAPPAHLAALARSQLAGDGANVVPLRRPAARIMPPAETFQLLAAASASDDQAIVCRSATGLWTLQTFPGMSAADRAAGRGTLLVTVNPEHAASYEGLKLRAFVVVDGQERVLAEDIVRDGSVFAEISLAGLDLRNRDPVSVVFSAPDPE